MPRFRRIMYTSTPAAEDAASRTSNTDAAGFGTTAVAEALLGEESAATVSADAVADEIAVVALVDEAAAAVLAGDIPGIEESSVTVPDDTR